MKEFLFPALNLPESKLRVRKTNGKSHVFDRVRKKYVLLTPEEWVRQNFLTYLIEHKLVPEALVSIEMNIKFNQLNHRVDMAVHNRDYKPVLIVECKAPSVKITQETFDQIARYNLILDVNHLILTNGIKHYCCKMDAKNKSYDFQKNIPSFTDMV